MVGAQDDQPDGPARQPSGSGRAAQRVIDVFWKGSDGDQLWHGQYSPGKGWKGPQDLRGRLASGPSPVESSPGTVQVFWKGTDHQLWQVSRGPKTGWGRPYRLRMGRLRAGPFGAIGPGGKSVVFWRGRQGICGSPSRRRAAAGSGPATSAATWPRPATPARCSAADRPIAIPPQRRIFLTVLRPVHARLSMVYIYNGG
jgi:hypothetical protein